MLNRHFLRAKVLQLLYAFQINGCSDIEGHKKKLIDSFRHLVDLQTYLFSALMEFHTIASNRMNDNKQKMLPTEDDLNPNLKFIENEFFTKLFEDESLKKRMAKLKINWVEERDILRNIFNRFIASQSYKNYMSSGKGDFISERLIVVQLFKNYLISNEEFFETLCEKRLEWESDYDVIAQNALKYLRDFDGNTNIELDENYDIEFITSLYLNTTNNDKDLMELIEGRVKNWDIDRAALMDVIIIKMGVSELVYCPEIPVNVTLNEYVELAKEFSTQKSKLFVNGLLDKLMVDLRAKGKIKKIEFEVEEEEEEEI